MKQSNHYLTGTHLILVVLLLVGLTGYGIAEVADILDTGNPTGELVAHYRFDEGAGAVAYDGTNNSNDGSLVNFDTTTGWAEGVQGYGITEFADTTHRVEVPYDSSIDLTDRMTVSTWVKMDGETGNNQFVLSKYTGATTDSNQYSLFYNEGPDGMAWEIHDGSYQTITGDITVNDGKWHHVLGSFDGTELKLYVDGTLDGTLSYSGAADSDGSGTLYIGRQGRADNRKWNGTIDDVRIYNSALNHSQAKSLHNTGSSFRTATNPEKTNGRILDISFDRLNSTHVFDTSGNTNHGTPQDDASQLGAVHCKTGRCYDFDGNQDVIETSMDESITGEITVMAWAKIREYPSDGDQKLIHKPYDGSVTGWELKTPGAADSGSSGDYFRFQSFDGTAHGVEVNKSRFPLNTWVHITGVYNGTHWSLYKNGHDVSQNRYNNDGTGPVANGENVEIGDSESFGIDASIDEVKIFDKALSRDEILNEAGIERDGAVLDLRFDEPGGPTAYDTGMYGNDGSFVPDERTGPTRITGVSGYGLDMDDGNDRIDVSGPGTVSAALNNTASIMFWFRPASDQSVSWDNYADWNAENATGDTKTVQVETVGTNLDTIYTRWIADTNSCGDNGAGFWARSSSMGVIPGQWNLYTGIYNGTHALEYINGKLEEQSRKNCELADMTSDLQIRGDVLDYDLDRFRIYPYAVTSQTIKEEYADGKGSIARQRTDQNQLSDVLIGHWTFDAGNKTHTFDASSAANSGRISGPSQASTTDCVSGRCFSFDGANDHITIGDHPEYDLAGKNFTLTAWIKTGQTADQNIIDKDNLTDGWTWRLNQGSSGQYNMTLEITDAGSNAEVGHSATSPVDGQWHHVAVRWIESSQTAYYYLDGLSDGSGTAGFSWTSTDLPVQIGERTEQDFDQMDGSLDDIQVYNRSLSKSEIWRIYATGRDRAGENALAGPQAWYRMSDRGQVRDYSGEQNHADSHVVGEAGTFNTSDGEWVSVDFKQTYQDPVVVGTTNTQTMGGTAGALLFETRNVENGSADMRLCDIDAGQGCEAQGTERAGYIVIDAAKAEDVATIEAGKVSVGGDMDISGDAVTVTFNTAFATAPNVFAIPQTVSGERPVIAHVKSTSSNDFTVGVCDYDTGDICETPNANETVGWIAFNMTGLPFTNTHQNTETGNILNNDQYFQQFFTPSFSSRPAVIAAINGEAGTQDPLIPQIKDLNTTGFRIQNCEQESPDTDSCNNHNQENAAWFAAIPGILDLPTGSYNAPGWRTDCIISGCYSFDGSNDALELPQVLAGLNAFTVSFYADLTADDYTADSRLFSSGGSGTGQVLLWTDNTNPGLSFNAWDGSSNARIDSSAAPTGWTHVVGTWDGSTMRLYADGKEIGSQSFNADSIGDTGNKMYLGRDDGGNYFDGAIDDVRIYPYALTAEQVKEVMNGGGTQVG